MTKIELLAQKLKVVCAEEAMKREQMKLANFMNEWAAENVLIPAGEIVKHPYIEMEMVVIGSFTHFSLRLVVNGKIEDPLIGLYVRKLTKDGKVDVRKGVERMYEDQLKDLQRTGKTMTL